MTWIPFSEDDSRISDVSDEQFSAFDETDGSGSASCRWQTGSCLLPHGQVFPHFLLRGQESLADGFQNLQIVAKYCEIVAKYSECLDFKQLSCVPFPDSPDFRLCFCLKSRQKSWDTSLGLFHLKKIMTLNSQNNPA